MWRYLSTICLVMIGSWLHAVSLTGIVKDERTNKGIPFALIYVHDLHESFVSDENGRFEMDLEPGVYHLEFSSLGYYTYSLFEVEVIRAETKELEVSLEVKVSVLDSIVVQANEFYRTPESPLGVLGFSQHALMTTPGTTISVKIHQNVTRGKSEGGLRL